MVCPEFESACEAQNRASEIKDEIETVAPYAQYAASQLNLYSRLLSPLTASIRKRLLQKAYNDFYPVAQSLSSHSYSLEQFVAYHYCEAMYREEERITRLELAGSGINPDYAWAHMQDDHPYLKWTAPHKVVLSKLSQDRKIAVSMILEGEDSSGLAAVLAMTVNIALSVGEGIQSLRKTILEVVHTPQEAALLVGGVDYNRKDIVRLEGIGEVLLGDIDAFVRRSSMSQQWVDQFFEDDVTTLKEMLSQLEIARQKTLRGQHELFSLDGLRDRFGFEETSTGLLIPIRGNIVIATSLKEAVKKAQENREGLLGMSPRKFEEFIAFLFVELGFDVELTKCTRDGGADILCMKNLHGIPFHLAVEVKRYRNRPISVALVRSFVGANEVFHANKLIYVTTSHYTMPAMDYANRYVGHMLSLKQYDQIQEWCRFVRTKSGY